MRSKNGNGKSRAGAHSRRHELGKCRTGIHGLDEVTFGGLPRGRTTLVCGGPGCGKTLLGMEFLVRGASELNEPGVCISFEETAEELSRNVASLGFDVDALVKQKKLSIDYVFVERSLVEETGEFDLEALFVRIAYAVDAIGAKRVVLDSVESLFAGLPNESVLRAELRRLFRWLKDRHLTAIITGERGEGSLTRYGLEEYISDCVLLLDHRIHDAVFTRRLRIVKYRGSMHGTNEYPFLIDENGMSVLPLTSLELKHAAPKDRVSTGIVALDEMLGGKGYYRGSSILLSGSAGTGKTSLAAHFVDAACRRGERCMIFAYEESPSQLVRNMRSIGLNLDRWSDKGLLQIDSARPTTHGMESHLVNLHRKIAAMNPSVVVIDPITSLLQAGSNVDARGMLLRLIDHLKERQITGLLTTLTKGDAVEQSTSVDVSSLADTWVLLRELENVGERNRGLYIIKSRGLAHSNQIREMLITDKGIQLRDVYLGEDGIYTGSARVAREASDAAKALVLRDDTEQRRAAIARRSMALESQIAALELELSSDEQEAERLLARKRLQSTSAAHLREELAKSRSINVIATTVKPPSRKRQNANGVRDRKGS